MTSLYAKTGRDGKFAHQALSETDGSTDGAETIVARTSQWAVSPTMATSTEWGDSEGEGFTNRAAGRKDATFTAEGKYDTAESTGRPAAITQTITEVFELFQPGDIAQIVLWLDGRTALEATPDAFLYWDFPRALCSDFGLTVNIDTEEVIGWTTSFGADGRYFYPGEANANVRTIPA